MSSRETLHLLLLTHTQNEAESIVSLLRNSGSATRAHQIESLADLNEQLQEKSWDLLLAYPQVGDIRYEELLNLIKRLNKDLPVILLNDEVDAMQMEGCIRKGACIMVPIDESNLLLLVIQRELRHLRSRRDVRMLEVRLRDAEKRGQSLLESSRDPVAFIHDGMHVYANKAYLDLFGYPSAEDLEGMPIMDMLDTAAQSEFKQFLKTLQQDSNQRLEFSSTGINGKGQPFAMRMSFAPASYADEECTQVVIYTSSGNADLEEKLHEINSRDLLTGLYNKPFLIGQLEQAVDKAVMKGAHGGVLYINIDQFGKIKSDVGISHADTVIVEVAHALKARLSEQDTLARIGEDIFCCLRMDSDADAILKLADNLRDTIEHLLIEIGNRTVTATASIGVALISDTSSRPDDILQQAHHAADEVRKEADTIRGNGVHLFVAKEQHEEKHAQNLQKTLTDAIRSNSFRLLFQPMISLRGDETEHYETLLRLKMPDGNELSAGQFFADPSVSDELKRKIDRWVVLHTTKLLSEHRAKGHNTRMFINLCGASLADEALPGWIGVAINAANLPKGSVVFQFHEDDASRMLKQAQDFSHGLMEKGIPTALSRFGCALNPLHILKHLAVSYVKVDGSFTQELSNADAQKHLKELLTQLHEEEKLTIVPLVENATSVASLWQLGVHFIQGYYVQAPQAALSFDFSDDSEM